MNHRVVIGNARLPSKGIELRSNKENRVINSFFFQSRGKSEDSLCNRCRLVCHCMKLVSGYVIVTYLWKGFSCGPLSNRCTVKKTKKNPGGAKTERWATHLSAKPNTPSETSLSHISTCSCHGYRRPCWCQVLRFLWVEAFSLSFKKKNKTERTETHVFTLQAVNHSEWFGRCSLSRDGEREGVWRCPPQSERTRACVCDCVCVHRSIDRNEVTGLSVLWSLLSVCPDRCRPEQLYKDWCMTRQPVS